MSIAAKLEAVRKRLIEQDEEAWGPASSDAADSDYASGAAGEGGAHNVSDVNDNLTDYVLSLVDSMSSMLDVDDEEAIDFVFDVADELASEGTLPSLPSEDDLVGTAAWLGAAQMMGFGDLVFSLANNEFDALEEEEE